METKKKNKNKIKHILFLALFLLVLIIVILFLLSDRRQDEESENTEGWQESEISSLYFSTSQMSQVDSFSFYMGLSSETGKPLLSANYYNEEGLEIYLKEIDIDPSYMDRLNDIVRKNKLGDIKPSKNKRNYPHLADRTYHSLEISWLGGQEKSLDFWPQGSEGLLEFFQEVSDRYAMEKLDEARKNPKLESLLLSYKHPQEKKSFRFFISYEERQDLYLFYTSYFTEKDEEINLNETIEARYIEELEALIEKIGLFEIEDRKGPAASLDKEGGSYSFIISLTHGGSRELDYKEDGGEKIREFLFKLAEAYRD